MVQVLDARSVLEIGTYFGGGTKVLADALQGRGMVLTIDSNGPRASYVEAEIATWPQPMRDATMFLPYSAADLFATFFQRKEFWFDVCIVDGDHRHTAALADLLNCARFAGPGAVILVDDSTQPPVFNAVKDFLQLRPEWREIGGAIAGHSPAAAFTSMRPSFQGPPFLVLAGPDYPGIGRHPYSAGATVGQPVHGIGLDLARPAQSGTLQGRFAISYVDESQPHMVQADATLEVASGSRRVDLRLVEPLGAGGGQSVAAEVCLYWHGPDDESVLALAGPVRFLVD